MNRAEIRNLVIDHTGLTNKVSLINSMITAALKKVSAEKDWGDLLTEASVSTIVDVETVVLATGLRRLTEVRLIDGLSSYEIEVRPKNWIVERWPDLSALASSRPRYAYLQGINLHLVPPPNTIWTIKYSYFKRAADLTNETTELVPDIFDEAVIAYATYRTFKSVQMHEDAIVWFADYREAIKDAKRMDTSSAIQRKATPRGYGQAIQSNYNLDPFVRRTL